MIMGQMTKSIVFDYDTAKHLIDTKLAIVHSRIEELLTKWEVSTINETTGGCEKWSFRGVRT